jgi:phenylacetate-CoA ligase
MIYNSNIRYYLLRLIDILSGNRIKRALNSIDNFHTTNTKHLSSNSIKLDRILEHAIKTVPYYIENVKSNRIDLFPVVNKNILKKDINSFISNNYIKENLHTSTTSGSTGSPFLFYYDDNKKFNKTIEVIYYNRWVNYKLGDRHLLNAVGKKKSRFKLFFQNEIISNPTLMSEEWLEKQRILLKRKKLLFYVGYASVIKELSEYCKKMGDKPSDFKLKGIKSTAERLDENARNTAEKVFGCPVLCRYGCMETGIIAQECLEKKNYHINTANYYVEVLEIDTDKPVIPGEIGRVVVTDLNNYGMPFIRYDIGDFAILSDSECTCGKKGPIFSKVIGRIVENVTDSNGNLISWVAINDKMWPYTKVTFFQFIQKTTNRYLLLLQSEKDVKMEALIRSDFMSLLGPSANLEIEFVDEIKNSGTGKRPYIINEHLKK